MNKQLRSLLQLIVSTTAEPEQNYWLVGGFVRDLFLGRTSPDADVDIVVSHDSKEAATRLAKALHGRVSVEERFGTAKVFIPEGSIVFGELLDCFREVDFAHFRSERYSAPGKLPEVERASSLRIDLERRDFSVNALALPIQAVLETESTELESAVVDYFGGVSDLREGVLRVLHQKSFLDDPTRILRGFRYRTRLAMSFESRTEQNLQEAIHSGALGTISSIRYLNELKKSFLEGSLGGMLEDIELYSAYHDRVPLGEGAGKRLKGALTKLVSIGGREQDDRLTDALFLITLIAFSQSSPWTEEFLLPFQLPKKERKELHRATQNYFGGSFKLIPKKFRMAAELFRG